MTKSFLLPLSTNIPPFDDTNKHKDTLLTMITPCVSVLIAVVGAELVGINNRDLNTFEVDLHHSVRMRGQIPADRLVVGESGIFSHADSQMLADSGVNAMLVGESLMRAENIGDAVKTLLFGE